MNEIATDETILRSHQQTQRTWKRSFGRRRANSDGDIPSITVENFVPQCVWDDSVIDINYVSGFLFYIYCGIYVYNTHCTHLDALLVVSPNPDDRRIQTVANVYGEEGSWYSPPEILPWFWIRL